MTLEQIKAEIDRYYDAVPMNIGERDLGELVDYIGSKVMVRGWKRLLMQPGKKVGDPTTYVDPDVYPWNCR